MKTEKPIMECNYSDADQLKSLVRFAEELLSMGASIKLYEEEELITLEMVRNLIGTIEGVAKDSEAIDNVKFGDDSDD